MKVNVLVKMSLILAAMLCTQQASACSRCVAKTLDASMVRGVAVDVE